MIQLQPVVLVQFLRVMVLIWIGRNNASQDVVQDSIEASLSDISDGLLNSIKHIKSNEKKI